MASICQMINGSPKLAADSRLHLPSFKTATSYSVQFALNTAYLENYGYIVLPNASGTPEELALLDFCGNQRLRNRPRLPLLLILWAEHRHLRWNGDDSAYIDSRLFVAFTRSRIWLLRSGSRGRSHATIASHTLVGRPRFRSISYNRRYLHRYSRSAFAPCSPVSFHGLPLRSSLGWHAERWDGSGNHDNI